MFTPVHAQIQKQKSAAVIGDGVRKSNAIELGYRWPSILFLRSALLFAL